MRVSLMVEGQAGLTWARWRELVARVEDWGFAGLYRSDHFTMSGPSRENSLELIVSLAYAAEHTHRATLGSLVAPLSMRDPVMLARQAAQLDDLSGGRMMLGVGAGWQAREHETFGYALLDTPARMERFAEGLHVIWLLLKGDGPVSFQGRWFGLREAELLPRPFKTRILVGGNGERYTLPLAARYADAWNGVQLSPERFQELDARLDLLLEQEGRAPGDLTRTVATFLYFGRDESALERRAARLRVAPGAAELSTRQLLQRARAERSAITGPADEVVPQIQAYATAGVQELMLQTFDSDDLQGLEALAHDVLPQVS